MLTFFWISDTERFLKLVNKSCGEVMLHMPDGSKRDLKHNGDANQMLEAVKSRGTGVKISLSNHRDTESFIQYMAEAVL